MPKKLKITILATEPKKYTISFFALAFTVLAVIITVFESIPASSPDVTVKFLLMAVFGFAFSPLIARIDMSFNGFINELIGIGFGAGLVILLSILPQSIAVASATSTQLTLLAPVSEEWFFRMFVLGFFILVGIKIHFEELAYIALVPVSAIFAWFHAFVYNVELASVFIPLFSGGVIFGLAFILTKSIGAAMFAHLFVNAFSLGLLGFTIFSVLIGISFTMFIGFTGILGIVSLQYILRRFTHHEEKH